MVVIRLARGGAKKKPFYRVVVADKRMPRDGRFIEQLGTYDPRLKEHAVRVRLDRVDHWLSQGALPSERVEHIIDVYRKAQPAEATA